MAARHSHVDGACQHHRPDSDATLAAPSPKCEQARRTVVTTSFGQTLFKLRSLTPIPVAVACVALVWWGRTEPGPGGAAVDFALDALGLWFAAAGQALRFYTLGWVPEGTSGQDLSIQASTLNTTGPYARVRNPLYVGNLGIVLGLCLVAHSPWVYPLALGFFFFEYHFIIRAEEAFLRGKFGAAFDDFVQKVPRWVPRLTPAFEGALRAGRFDAARAVKKEVNPFSLWTLGMLGLVALQTTARGQATAALQLALAVAAGLIVVLLLIVKAWKKGWLGT